MVDPQRFWARDDIPADAGLSAEQVRDCEARLGVRLPESCVELFSVQNGGRVRDEYLELFRLPTNDGIDRFETVESLEQIAADDEFVRGFVEQELGDPRLVLLIAGEGSCFHALDFNVNGADGEPRVVWLYFDLDHCEEISPTFDDFVDKLMQSDAAPAVDLDEIERLPVIAHEIVDYDDEDGASAHVNQQLCDSGGTLVLFVDRNGLEGHELLRVEITKPLDPDDCMVSEEETDPPYVLGLEPEDPDSIVSTVSRQTSDGRWKNETTRGILSDAELESKDKSRLRELRRRLLGDVCGDLAYDD